MSFLNKIKRKLQSRLNNKYPNSISVYNNYKSNNKEYYSRHKIKSLFFLNKLISYEKKGKDLLNIKFPNNKNDFNQELINAKLAKTDEISAKELATKFLKYDVISFDIFDTCIFRNLDKPTELFFKIEKQFNIENFKEMRIKAEIDARAKTKKDNGEIDIYDIYEELKNLNCKAENEIDLELEYCYANSYMLEVFNILKENNKTIIATSDMFLPKEIIEKILLKNGFNGFDKIFVSNEYKCNKGDGKLFNIVKKMYKNKKFIHIGDNYFADVLGAKKAKIDSHYYQR